MKCGFAEQEKSSFLKKRSKRLLIIGARLAGRARKGTKVFCFFFSKKKTLFPFTPAAHAAE
jgi:hypothetical protein